MNQKNQESGKYEPWAFARLNLEKAFLEITDYHEKLRPDILNEVI